jgi:tryptophan synthase alpha chain
MPFITAGYPSLEATEQVIPKLEKAGASIIEVGFPFSDPIADGPVIAASMHQALQSGVTPRQIFDVIARVRNKTNLGLLAMVSDSIITRMGPEQFICDAAAGGFDGLIVPDIDVDAAAPIAGLAKIHNLTLTLLIAPTTADERIERIAHLCTGFIYLLARVGITGESQSLDLKNLTARMKQIRQYTNLPVAVGFGISSRAHVQQVLQIADAAIVGSALVRRMGGPDAVAAAADFVADLSSVCPPVSA